ncbi:MAG: hypothetical protein L0241_31555 [Planctomycetia bacterium]|nr:hypothetical protein [Planctomycetia bacterium]
MPLLDHFHPPLSRTHPWRTFHGHWATAMARLLNVGILPSGYYAAVFLDRDGLIEIDVATLQPFEPLASGNGAGGTQPWSPGEPQLAVAVEWPSLDDVRVEVLTDDGDPRLAAAVELVSPRNKDRAKSREAFAAKCADHLRHGCGVVVVDVVNTRHANLQAELFAAVGAEPGAGLPEGLSAVSYRSVGRDTEGQLQAWPVALEVGQSLPTVPLWLAGELAVPLDLEASHTAACMDLRIRQAG